MGAVVCVDGLLSIAESIWRIEEECIEMKGVHIGKRVKD